MKNPILPLLVSAMLLACTGDADHRYNVDIRWTSYGIPHVKANDWGSLGYGFAYATATDGICVFAREVARANGTMSADFGASDENLASDTFHRAMVTQDRVQRNAAAMSGNMRAYNAGFAAGYNRYIEDKRATLPAACAGEHWVRSISELDLGRMFIAFNIRYGTGNFQAGIAAAAPPGEPVAAVELDYDTRPGIGSNAIALGSELTRSGKGILFGNPHYPWDGPARFHMIHTTIPGEVDTMGVSLLSGSFIAIGFNRDIAWTHTVSTALRFTLFELELNPENPLQYRYGNEFRDI
ncbi:MAG: penicillin acylase family protein, partial [Gammaproteobacteria bacterium]|nr:penicillin acylase family protein [Gammaproteobacteria bacterium]